VAAVAPFAAIVILAACSSSGSTPPVATPEDAAAIDAPIGPLFCNLPVPAICPNSAPCTFAAWHCSQAACEGYFVITDGAWVYYYSSPSGELAGEVPEGDDASFLSCPYGFEPPVSCAPVVASQCSSDAASSPEAG